MIPKRMEIYLRQQLLESTWQRHLECKNGLCFMEFNATDVEQLSRLGIVADALGPQLVVCMWDESSPLELGGYLVVDNLAMGRPSMGGIRMLPEVTPAEIYNLARGMTLKNTAAHLPYGGGKSGIFSEIGLTSEQHTEVVRGWARLLFRYLDIYLPGPDVGTNDADMKTIAIENGIDHVLSKPIDMGGNSIDQLGAAAGGTIIALQALLEELPRLQALPHFAGLRIPAPHEVTVLIQGFGAVGAHAARILGERLPQARVIGVSDVAGYLYDERGLPVGELFQRWQQDGIVTHPYFLAHREDTSGGAFKYSTQPNDLLCENAFCLITAAPIANYLDIDTTSHPSMTVDRMGRWVVSVEGTNTYSPDPARKAARHSMEQIVYRQRGVLIATDYLVNSGGVIFAAQEKLIETPPELHLPQEIIGQRVAVDKWLATHAAEFTELAEKRRLAAVEHRELALRSNMHELVNLLISDANMLPSDAAERISARRIATRAPTVYGA